MKKRFIFFSSIIALLASLFVTHILNGKHVVYPVDSMTELYNDVNKFTKESGLRTVAIVTGSTSGIGQELAIELYRLGAVVIVASRNKAKCQNVVNKISSMYPNSAGSLEVGILDTSDLDSVKSFIGDFQSKYSHLNYLINNAGIHYVSAENVPLMNSTASIESQQGYDLSFATNYLGHFLLTDKLLPMITHGRIVNIASTYHFQADGKTLLPSKHADELLNGTSRKLTPPTAAQIVNSFHHRRIAYGVSKLAQVLHVKELQRRLDMNALHSSSSFDLNTDSAMQMTRNVKAVSVCPGWVSTNMIPGDFVGQFIRDNAFTGRASILAPMCALLNDSLKGGEFVTNTYIPFTQHFWSPALFRFMSTLGVRNLFADILAFILLLRQNSNYGCHVQRSSPESYDEELARELYDWTISELAERGY